MKAIDLTKILKPSSTRLVKGWRYRNGGRFYCLLIEPHMDWPITTRLEEGGILTHKKDGKNLPFSSSYYDIISHKEIRLIKSPCKKFPKSVLEYGKVKRK